MFKAIVIPAVSSAALLLGGVALAGSHEPITQSGNQQTDPTSAPIEERNFTRADCPGAGTDGQITIASSTMTDEERSAALKAFCDSLGTDGKITTQ